MKVRLIFIAAMLAGCSSTPVEKKSEFDSSFSVAQDTTRVTTEEIDLGGEGSLDGATSLDSIYPNQREENLNVKVAQVNFDDEEKVSFSSENMPLGDFINNVLANILKVNFLLDPNIGDLSRQTVTLNLDESVSKQRFFNIFYETLLSHGLSLTTKNGLFYVYKDSNQGFFEKIRIGIGRTINDLPVDGDEITQIFPIRYSNLDSIKSMVHSLTTAMVKPLGEQNSFVLLKGKRNDVVRALKIVEYLDVPASVGKHIEFISLDYLEPAEFIDKMRELLDIEGINLDVTLKMTELPRHGGLVVHSEQRDVLDRVLYWKNKLDTEQAKGKKRYVLYFPENSLASKLGEGLSNLLALQVGQSSSTKSTSTSSSVDGRQNNSQASSGKDGASVSFASDDLAMVSDDNRNALIFYTTPAKYQSLLPIIKKLDVLPKQVLVEAKFLEVTLTDRFSNGVEWALSNELNTTSTDPLGRFSNGSFSFNVSDLDYTFALNFLKQDSKVKVLSSPRVLVTDGKSASINVGSQVPVLTTQSNDVDTDRVLQSVQYRSTGVQLTVTPVINAQGVVSLTINQSVSETSEDTVSELNSPVILDRSISTEIIASSGKTVILGGLIRENNSSSDNGVPVLRDLPVLGNLFKSQGESKTRTELVVMLTPRIIHNTSALNEISDIFKNDMTLFE